jgi:DNA repair protein RadC
MSDLCEFREFTPEVTLRCINPCVRINKKPIDCQEEIPDGIMDFLSTATVEHVITLQLGNDLRLINYSVIAKGTICNALFSVSEIIRTAILSNSHSIMMLHNHTSVAHDQYADCPTPSKEDKEIAVKTYQALQLVGIRLIDFCIVGPNKSLYSFRRNKIAPYDIIHEPILTYVK